MFRDYDCTELPYLKIYNMLGEEVATMVNERLTPGVYTKIWNDATLPSGTYLYRLKAGDVTLVKKMVIVK